MNSEKYICIHMGTETTDRCKEDCCGITNSCGLYENPTGERPFYDFREQLEVKRLEWKSA